MRILITGVSGQVGAALAQRFRHHNVIAADRSLIDLSRPEKIATILDRLAPTVIINAAAYTAVDRAETERELANLVNAIAPGVLARWAARKRVPLVQFSTDYVFDGCGDKPWREDDVAAPLSVYGQTKLEGEKAVRSAGGVCLIVRTSWVYAATGKNFLRTIARLACEREELSVVADQIGTPTSAALIADCMRQMFSGGLDGFRNNCAKSNQIVHLTASGETSWYGFATAIVEGLRERGVSLAIKHIVPIKTEQYPTPAKRPLNSRLDLSRLHQVFKITPVDWLNALKPELDALAAELRSPNLRASASGRGRS